VQPFPVPFNKIFTSWYICHHPQRALGGKQFGRCGAPRFAAVRVNHSRVRNSKCLSCIHSTR
jgi:hypothetical protein